MILFGPTDLGGAVDARSVTHQQFYHCNLILLAGDVQCGEAVLTSHTHTHTHTQTDTHHTYTHAFNYLFKHFLYFVGGVAQLV